MGNIHIIKYYSALTWKEIEKWYNMDETWEHFAKWIKPVVQKTNIVWSHLHDISGVVKFTETDNRMWLPGTRGGQNGELLFHRYRVSVLQNEKYLEIDSTMIWMYLTLLNCTSRNC